MLQKVSIQNFKSLKDVTLELQKVNLLIGPNNSGKSNFLKALELLANCVQGDDIDFDYLMNSHYMKQLNRRNLISFTTQINLHEVNTIHHLEISPSPIERKIGFAEFIGHPQNEQQSFELNFSDREALNTNYSSFELAVKDYPFKKFTNLKTDNVKTFHLHKVGGKVLEAPLEADFGKFIYSALTGEFFTDVMAYGIDYMFSDIEVYRPDPNKIIIPQDLNSVKVLNGDCSNLIAFLFTLSIDDESAFQKIQDDFAKCVVDFVKIKTPPINTNEGGKLSLKFFDKEGNDYWADELSEGTLYFLALLCIVHQPNPPKLLLLEEPEKGIHPRRIHEVMKFIFQLAEDKDIQVIMTSHNEHVLSEFAIIPEAVFIFDKDEEGATQVKNLKRDVIEPDTKKAEEFGIDPIDFTDNIGENWFMGLMGGVPA
jgi:AAA15 family ATPase/GTPase